MENNRRFLHQLSDMETYFHHQEKAGNILRKCPEISEKARKYGNKLYTQTGHNKQSHQNILLQYTKSIAFAPKDDEKLALGYSNRSALLMHLRHYEECIGDIDKALEITMSEELKAKLEDRKTRCLALMKKSKVMADPLCKSVKSLKLTDKEINDTVFELPSIIKSMEALRISKLVNLKYNKTFGRHVVANQDIKPGEIIIAEKCYACFPELDQIYLVCSNCLRIAWNGIPCDFCAFSIYCSETCKKIAWQEYHDVECNILPYMYSDTIMHEVGMSLATRMLIKAVKAESLQNIISEAQSIKQHDNGIKRFLLDISLGEIKFGTCYNLQSSPNKRESDTDNPINEVMYLYLLYKFTGITYVEEKPDINNISDEKIFIIRDIFMKIVDIINLNQFCYQIGCTCPSIMNECVNDCDLSKGHFIAPYCCLVNHSCIPNVGMLCLSQQKIVLYAIQPIKKNEQIFYTYGPILDGCEIPDRTNFLLHRYYFRCQCMACKGNWTFNCNTALSKSELPAYAKLLLEFQQRLHAARDFNKNQFLNEYPNEWQLIDETSLHQALQLCELSYKSFKNQSAFICTIRYRRYIRKALCKLYGEKYDIPNHC